MGYFQEIYQAEILHRCVTVYMYLKDRTGRKGTCWPAIGTIGTRLRTVAQHGKEGVEGSGGKGIFEERNPSQGKWGGLLQTAIPFCKEKGHTWGKVCPDSGPGIGAG